MFTMKFGSRCNSKFRLLLSLNTRTYKKKQGQIYSTLKDSFLNSARLAAKQIFKELTLYSCRERKFRFNTGRTRCQLNATLTTHLLPRGSPIIKWLLTLMEISFDIYFLEVLLMLFDQSFEGKFTISGF